jgi:hypothetical protein
MTNDIAKLQSNCDKMSISLAQKDSVINQKSQEATNLLK